MNIAELLCLKYKNIMYEFSIAISCVCDPNAFTLETILTASDAELISMASNNSKFSYYKEEFRAFELSGSGEVYIADEYIARANK